MTATAFVSALKQQTSDAAVQGTIEQMIRPSGRKSDEPELALARWYATLNDFDKEMLRKALVESAESAVFAFLCVLDGVRAIENRRDKGTLRLTYVHSNEEVLLNDPAACLLHDEFQIVSGKVTE